MRQLEIQIPPDPSESSEPRSKDWISQAISTDFADPDARRSVAYSVYISKLEAIQIVTEALAEGIDVSEVAHDFCDQEGLYGAARREVIDRVWGEYRWIDDFLS